MYTVLPATLLLSLLRLLSLLGMYALLDTAPTASTLGPVGVSSCPYSCSSCSLWSRRPSAASSLIGVSWDRMAAQEELEPYEETMCRNRESGK
ncbi:uncharacterized protein UBRO_20134 [Ustilago bromivora]|uniref:Secreted protein n=1 Tax=Ustilago bromivora TaxID=307758 RepID=A0A1K0FVJ9_9BASI|nr:uncharacterized protein UBRO_20134 [Ustilago bromivora]